MAEATLEQLLQSPHSAVHQWVQAGSAVVDSEEVSTIAEVAVSEVAEVVASEVIGRAMAIVVGMVELEEVWAIRMAIRLMAHLLDRGLVAAMVVIEVATAAEAVVGMMTVDHAMLIMSRYRHVEVVIGIVTVVEVEVGMVAADRRGRMMVDRATTTRGHGEGTSRSIRW